MSLYVKRNIRYLEKVKSVHLLSGSLFLVLLFGVFASEFGMAAIIGAYFSGLIISRTSLQHKIFDEIERFGNGFFIPLFFVNIGLSIDLSNVGQHFVFAMGITALAILSKIIANLGVRSGLVGNDVFTAAIVLVFISSVLTPVLLKLTETSRNSSVKLSGSNRVSTQK